MSGVDFLDKLLDLSAEQAGTHCRPFSIFYFPHRTFFLIQF